jgi:hypothetical protein
VDWNILLEIFERTVVPTVHRYMHAGFFLHPLTLVNPLKDDTVNAMCEAGSSHVALVLEGIGAVAGPDVPAGELLAEFHRYELRECRALRPENLLVKGITKDTNPGVWWDSLRSEFPLLSRVARRLFAIPPSSSGIERTWSNYSRIQAKCRNRMSVATAQKLVTCFTSLKCQKTGEGPEQPRQKPLDPLEELEGWTEKLVRQGPEVEPDDSDDDVLVLSDHKEDKGKRKVPEANDDESADDAISDWENSEEEMTSEFDNEEEEPDSETEPSRSPSEGSQEIERMMPRIPRVKPGNNDSEAAQILRPCHQGPPKRGPKRSQHCVSEGSDRPRRVPRKPPNLSDDEGDTAVAPVRKKRRTD